LTFILIFTANFRQNLHQSSIAFSDLCTFQNGPRSFVNLKQFWENRSKTVVEGSGNLLKQLWEGLKHL